LKDQTMPEAHTVTSYDDDLRFLTRRLSEMGGIAERMVADAVAALVNADTGSAQRVISEDLLLDNGEREIYDKAVLVIAKRQPMASDLREIIGSIRIASDLERVGDLGKNIAKRVIAVHTMAQPRKLVRGLEHLAELALTQLKEVLDAFATRSPDLANSIRERDEEIDAIYTSLFPRTLDLHDGRSAQHHRLYPFAVLRQEHRAHRRSRHQHRRDGLLRRHRRAAGSRTAQG
jgi:phosphate transport system protein